ncbi:MAG: hypothetical protein SAK29_11260 [Scytonema sp. PMC 1069.18]|nr:hypothetical protein [Scytonema sp. PMC 1069.18]MEC4886658.1 hypothetical protein [Scytonema sp. PMC 1070.18]
MTCFVCGQQKILHCDRTSKEIQKFWGLGSKQVLTGNCDTPAQRHQLISRLVNGVSRLHAQESSWHASQGIFPVYSSTVVSHEPGNNRKVKMTKN